MRGVFFCGEAIKGKVWRACVGVQEVFSGNLCGIFGGYLDYLLKSSTNVEKPLGFLCF